MSSDARRQRRDHRGSDDDDRLRRNRLLRGPQIWESTPDVERIAFFSDAVFAIAITLLVVELTVPEGPASRLGAALRELGPKFFAFALSFLVIGQFWMAHHRIFRYVRRYDLGLLWVNLLFLLTVAFLPFPTALLGAYFDAHIAGVFYGLSLFVPSALGMVLWFYASSRALLGDVPRATRHQIVMRGIATPVVFLLGTGAALFDTRLAVFCWTVLVPMARVGLALVVRPAEE